MLRPRPEMPKNTHVFWQKLSCVRVYVCAFVGSCVEKEVCVCVCVRLAQPTKLSSCSYLEGGRINEMPGLSGVHPLTRLGGDGDHNNKKVLCSFRISLVLRDMNCYPMCTECSSFVKFGSTSNDLCIL